MLHVCFRHPNTVAAWGHEARSPLVWPILPALRSYSTNALVPVVIDDALELWESNTLLGSTAAQRTCAE
jgi:hypothetical protein